MMMNKDIQTHYPWFKALDSQILYTATEFYSQLSMYTNELYRSYYNFQYADFCFIIAYSVFFASLISFVKDKWVKVLVVLPFVAGGLDIIENIGLRFLMVQYPVEYMGVPEIIGVVTLLKFTLIMGVFIAGIVRLINKKVTEHRMS